MAILQVLLAALTHSLGKVLSTLFGWATALLFGRVAEKQQILLSVAMFSSVIWLAVVLGVVFPPLGLFLVASFVPKSIAAHENLVRLLMLAAALVLPFINGATLLPGKESDLHAPPRAFKDVLQGWTYTIGLAMTLAMMCLFAPILKLQLILKRRVGEHVAVTVPGSDYLKAVADIETVLEAAGYSVKREEPSWMITLPTKVLTYFAGKHVQQFVADHLTVLSSQHFDVLLHPSDMVITGQRRYVNRLHALLSERLTFSHILFTWEDKAMALEKRLRLPWLDAGNSLSEQRGKLSRELAQAKRDLAALGIDHEQWETLYRELLQAETRLLPEQYRGELDAAA